MYESIRKTLSDYYFDVLPERVENIKNAVFEKMDIYDRENPGLSAYKLKEKMYDVIADHMELEIFDELPFFFETGVLVAPSDGRYRHGSQIRHANAWLYLRNSHLLEEVDPQAFRLYSADKSAALYAQTGVFVDIMHIGLPLKKVFDMGLCGVMKQLQDVDMKQCDETEREFFQCAMAGVCALRKIARRFAQKARSLGQYELADIAQRVPWEAPKTFHEGLCAMAFMRKVLGSFEGVGFNSFGRVDLLLQPLYLADKARGISDENILDDISKFLLIWDCALDRRKKAESGADYELENTLTLGGCDEHGEPVFNNVTRLFIQARDNLELLYPKMMLRFSAQSPGEYMKLLAQPLVSGKSFSLLENDDIVIPAMIESGIEPDDARNYSVGGCWDLLTLEQSNVFGGEYVSIVRPLEWAIHQDQEWMEKTRLVMEPIDDVSDFEELYHTYLGYIKKLLWRKAEPMSVASREWHRVNPVCILSALMETCIPKKRDLTNGGGKYNRECIYFSGFAQVVDSLLAIKNLCFDKKICTVRELFDACRNNWTNEVLRQCAIHAPSYGDGCEESSQMAGRLYDDLYEISRGLPTAYGGEFRIGYNQYTEIVWWGKRIKALPNGRRDGEYISAGITPSRLQNPVSLAEMMSSLRYVDAKKCAGNTSITLSIPAGQHMETDTMIAILYAISKYNVKAFQINCVSLETLRRAQEEPENYSHIIVRVCGFSAPFVLLSPTYQEEVISRMLTGG